MSRGIGSKHLITKYPVYRYLYQKWCNLLNEKILKISLFYALKLQFGQFSSFDSNDMFHFKLNFLFELFEIKHSIN